MPEITDEQRAAEAAACPYCRRKAEDEANARMAWENEVLRDELRDESLARQMFLEEITTLRVELCAAVDALRKLKAEAKGFVALADRETYGNTNIAVMNLRIKEAGVIIAAYDEKNPEWK